uniref:Uncharacterized protein n=1 Tax=Anguilla anguilla TaxID=7936 RepID=A0A0E9RCT9_ANGAN
MKVLWGCMEGCWKEGARLPRPPSYYIGVLLAVLFLLLTLCFLNNNKKKAKTKTKKRKDQRTMCVITSYTKQMDRRVSARSNLAI